MKTPSASFQTALHLVFKKPNLAKETFQAGSPQSEMILEGAVRIWILMLFHKQTQMSTHISAPLHHYHQGLCCFQSLQN